MTNRLELNWKLDGFVDEQRYYCSETPIDPLNLPVPKAVLSGDVRTYIDTDIEVGKTYFVRVGSVKNGVEKISDEMLVAAEKLLVYMPLVSDFNNYGSMSISTSGNVATFDVTKGVRFQNSGDYLDIVGSIINFNSDYQISFDMTLSSLASDLSIYGLILCNSNQNWVSSARYFSLQIAQVSTWSPLGTLEVGVTNIYAQSSSQVATVNNTVNVKISKTSGVMRLYLNNVLVAETSNSAAVTNSNILRFGQSSAVAGSPKTFRGYIKNLKVYDLT